MANTRRTRLPKGWPARVKSAISHVIALVVVRTTWNNGRGSQTLMFHD